MAMEVSPLALPLPALPAIAGVALGTAAAAIRYTSRDDVTRMVFPAGTLNRNT